MTDKSSFGQILKSSSIMGAAAVIALIFGMVRTKFAAVLIGTTGVGLLANYYVILGLMGTITGLGIHCSAVRDIVNAVSKNDKQEIGRAVVTMRRVCWFTGLAGMLAMFLLSTIFSQHTFGSQEYTLEISLLGITILLGNLSGGQMALIQGMRKIGDLARVNIVTAAFSTIISIGFYAGMGVKGIAPALLSVAVIQLIVSWIYSRLTPVPIVSMSWYESILNAGGMIRLGFAFMWSTLISSAVSYAAYALITHQISLQAVGIYSAAFTLSGMFVNFVLQAMGADFYPRLTSVSSDNSAINKLVNEQTEIGLLLAMPGLIATLTLATWIVHIFYTSEFLPAVELIQWFTLGCMQRVVSWPLGFVLRAQGKIKLFVITETIFHGSHIALIYAGMMWGSLEGTAIAFLAMNTLVTIVIYLVVRRLTGFRWGASNRKLILINFLFISLAFVLARILPVWPETFVGLILTITSFLLCFRGFANRLGHNHRLIRNVCIIPGMSMVCRIKISDNS
jgi:antigen flippase